jgi:hypothetical protein
MVDRRERKEV